MRKLTVRNFSVIQEAELEFGKITVLIGPQSSGKSLLCKLAFFFGQVVPEIVNQCMARKSPYSDLQRVLLTEFQEKFHFRSWIGQDTEIRFDVGEFSVQVRANFQRLTLEADFDEAFQRGYSFRASTVGVVIPPSERPDRFEGHLFEEASIYIPTGRSFFSTPAKGYASFAGRNLDWVTQRFAVDIGDSYSSLEEIAPTEFSLMPDFHLQARKILGGTVRRMDGLAFFEPNSSARLLPFEILSSGTLELLPLLNPLGDKAAAAKHPFIPNLPGPKFGVIYIEEPESSIFPKTQYDLMRLIAWLSNEPRLNLSFALTTHSPYILSSFNNLLEAWQTGHINEERANAVRDVIDEKYWFNPDEFRAYAIKDGVLSSIVADDTKLISENYLDSVSETIGAEFDELLRIGYVEA